MICFQKHPQISSCPNPNCNIIFKSALNQSNPVSHDCECGTLVCSQCRLEEHQPLPCRLIELYAQKLDNRSRRWIGRHTKTCPSCKAPIEKNGGCSHMSCRKCTHAFCWDCLRPLRTHNAFECLKGVSKKNIEKSRGQNHEATTRKKIAEIEKMAKDLRAVSILEFCLWSILLVETIL